MRYVVVDYKMGNLKSVVNAFSRLGCDAIISDSPRDVQAADALILPGVGAFGVAMKSLREQQLVEPLRESVIGRGVPLLGICLGMQLLADSSEEMGHHKGLGFIPGRVTRLKPEGGLRVPHVGWSTTAITRTEPMFAGVDSAADFYFVHSFCFVCEPKYVTATCDYGTPVVAAVQRQNVFGTQFHPEKSQFSGLRVLRNFANHAARSTR